MVTDSRLCEHNGLRLMSYGCGWQLVCAVVAVLLHYCYTAVFIWMLVEGLHLYSKVVRVFGTERSRMTYYVCFGWGTSGNMHS